MHETSDIRISPLHFRPKTGRAGDVIAYYWKGQYHLFYLHGPVWAHNVSTDLIHWTELPVALEKSADPLDPDGEACWTGSIVEHGGTFTLFYTGKNKKDPKGDQKVMVATSKDLIHWQKQPTRTFYADGKIYWSKPINGPGEPMRYHHQAFRDPDVFWDEKENRWGMLLHAMTAEGHRACIGLYTSPDLVNWMPHAPLATYAEQISLDCPHAAPMGGRWFIIAADTSYVSTETVQGPYPPDMKLYDSGNLFVPKSLFDGKRRVIWGWINDLEGNRDSGKGIWGGTLCLPREIYPGPNGQLYSRPAAEATAAFTETAWKLLSPKSLPKGGRCSFKVPNDYMLRCTVQLDPEAVLTLRMRQQQDGAGYPLVVDPKKQEVGLSRGKSRFARGVELDAAEPIAIQAFVQGSIIECFIDDRFAFTLREYDYSKGELGFEVTGGSAKILDLTVRTLPVPVSKASMP